MSALQAIMMSQRYEDLPFDQRNLSLVTNARLSGLSVQINIGNCWVIPAL